MFTFTAVTKRWPYGGLWVVWAWTLRGNRKLSNRLCKVSSPKDYSSNISTHTHTFSFAYKYIFENQVLPLYIYMWMCLIRPSLNPERNIYIWVCRFVCIPTSNSDQETHNGRPCGDTLCAALCKQINPVIAIFFCRWCAIGAHDFSFGYGFYTRCVGAQVKLEIFCEHNWFWRKHKRIYNEWRWGQCLVNEFHQIGNATWWQLNKYKTILVLDKAKATWRN